MSEETRAVLTASNEAYNRGDMDAMVASYTPDVEAFPDASVFVEAAALHGRERWRAWLVEIGTAWDSPQWLSVEMFELADGRVMNRAEWCGAGAASGIEIASSITGIFSFRDGLISRVEYFFDHGEALRAAGLTE